ncbi:MAG: NTP transferase domain-containing protein [Polyangiaceae bacterium]|nr:NTP transferase domain-containing protein [Polyangiaceae bacterium]
MTRFTSLILAAGRGTRIGGPKALLLVGSGPDAAPLAEVQSRDHLAVGASTVAVVLRAREADMLAPRLQSRGVRIVVSEAPEEHGPAGSIAAAVRALDLAPPAVWLITPVDLRVAPQTLHAVATFNDPSAPRTVAVVPSFQGRKGHPVAILSSALTRYVEPNPPPLRDHLRSLADGVHILHVPDPNITENLNRSSQTQTLARITESALPPRFFADSAAPH